MDLNFRRLGRVCYRPCCDTCRECQMIRVRAHEFQPARAQRRCLKRNGDLVVRLEPSRPDTEAFELYRRYLVVRHNQQMAGSWEEFCDFLCESNTETFHATFRLEGRLLALGVVDVEPRALSAVYLAYEPSENRRSLGVFNVLWLIEECRRRGLPFLYLGYYVRGARTMRYKAAYRPCELLAEDGVWREVSVHTAGAVDSTGEP